MILIIDGGKLSLPDAGFNWIEPKAEAAARGSEVTEHQYTFHRWQDSPLIVLALKEGRKPSDIAVVTCDRCGSVTYYNQGSYCTCEHCDASLDYLLGRDTGEVTTLDDVMIAEAESIDVP